MQRRKDIGRAITELKSLHDAINTDVEENAYDLFGKSIASQLKKLSPESALVAQSRIQNILTELGLEDIREKDGSINKSTFSLYNISSHSISSDDTSTPPCGIDKPNSDLENNYYGDDLLATAIATSLQST